MRNAFKIIGTFIIVFIILLSMGAGIFAETTDLNQNEENLMDIQPEERKLEEQGSEKQISQDKEVVVEESREEAEQESQEQVQEEQKSDNDNHEESDRTDSLLEDTSIQTTVEKLDYPSDTSVFQLDIRSNSGHTRVVLAWMYEGDTYLGVISLKEIKKVIYENSSVDLNKDTIKRAVDRNCQLVVNNINYGSIDAFADKTNKFNKHHRWSVIKIKGQTLFSPFKLTIKVDSGNGHGHNIIDQTITCKQPEYGSLTITNLLINPTVKDKKKKFDIFIYGPEGKVYTVTLAHKESVTLKGLQYGKYTIKEMVPMNFKNIRGNEKIVEINDEQPNNKVVIKNQRLNYGWFYDDDFIEKTIEVGS